MTELVEVKISGLAGDALDWAVASAAGFEPTADHPLFKSGLMPFGLTKPPPYMPLGGLGFWPSRNWSHGGPLIESHITALNQTGTHTWWAHSEDRLGEGETALIAICRAIVASKFGDVASIPKELIR